MSEASAALIHRRRMARYRALPPAPCAACGGTVRVGTERDYLPAETARGLLAVHARCADAPVGGEALRRASAVAADLHMLLAARQLIDALSWRESVSGESVAILKCRSAARRLERIALRGLEKAAGNKKGKKR